MRYLLGNAECAHNLVPPDLLVSKTDEFATPGCSEAGAIGPVSKDSSPLKCLPAVKNN
jgi:hypothetical protein